MYNIVNNIKSLHCQQMFFYSRKQFCNVPLNIPLIYNWKKNLQDGKGWWHSTRRAGSQNANARNHHWCMVLAYAVTQQADLAKLNSSFFSLSLYIYLIVRGIVIAGNNLIKKSQRAYCILITRQFARRIGRNKVYRSLCSVWDERWIYA